MCAASDFLNFATKKIAAVRSRGDEVFKFLFYNRKNERNASKNISLSG